MAAYRYQVARGEFATGWRILVTSAGFVNFRRFRRLTCQLETSRFAIA